ncbi:MAG: hypothetical protein JWP87_5252 [Labilithrix sp.]|nr:hypothetical protein [Labilithrix sp.]
MPPPDPSNPYAAPAPATDDGPRKKKKKGRYSARLDGDALVVANAKHAPLFPEVCMKCGAHEGILRRKVQFRWRPVWARFLVFCIIGLVILVVTTRRANLEIPLCASCNERWSAARNAGIAGIVVLVAALIAVRSTGAGRAELGGLFALVAAFVALAYVFIRPRVLPVKRIDDAEISLRGVHPRAAEEIVAASE